MPKKEDRSDWVAVGPEQSSSATPSSTIRKPTTAYQFFQKSVSQDCKQEIINEFGTFDIAQHGRLVRSKWNQLSDSDKEEFIQLQRQDTMRYNQESHMADVAALERRERLQRENNQLYFFNDNNNKNKRVTTRRKWNKKQRRNADQTELNSNDDDDSSDSFDSDALLSDSSLDEKTKQKKKKKKPPPKKQLTAKQLAHRDKMQREKREKEAYIQSRVADLRQEKAVQAKKRLEFLLQQSDIFSHFGTVQQEGAQYGTTKSSKDRRDQDDQAEAVALEEADEHEATFLTSQPSTMGYGTLRPYQLEGLNWMIGLQEHGVNGILADEMGLGKTCQSISILVYMMEFQNVTGPHLVVVPKSTLSNWMNELSRWAPTLNAVKFHGDKATREDIVSTILEPGQREEDRDWHVVVTTYEVCNIEKNTLNKFAWSYLIIDEAHRLKNEASTFSKTVRAFETRYRVLLTGTPLQNSLHELWSLLNFLVPDVFASAEQFDDWFNLDIDDADEKNKLISQLHKILRPFMLRRLKADVEKSLPPKHETILYTGMSAMQKKLYRDILIRDIDAIQGTSGNRTAILNIVMQLRKCAGHPYLFPGVEDRTLPPLGEHLIENCGKMVVLDKLLKRLHDKGHRVLLFTQMTRLLDIIEDYARFRRYKYCRIDGNTTYEDRESYIESYNAPNSELFLFLLSTRAGGLGINLQSADVVILFDSDWNPQADLQAQDRAHRIGQKKTVLVFRLVTEHTIEEKIVERAQQKLKLDAMVVQSGRLKDKDSKLSRDELLSAVRFGADKIFKSKDASITDDDIDMIIAAGEKRTQELNDKLKTVEKGDLLDFKLDGSSVQTFEGVDYSDALAKARAESEMMGIFDIGKRERKEANYNEASLFRQQVTALQGSPKKHKRKVIRLPKHLRLPRMDEWHMYDREALRKIQDEEEAAFKALPEEQQKLATATASADATPEDKPREEEFVLPPLISAERQAEKDKLLAEGFSSWKRHDYTLFVKASAKYGRDGIEKIAADTLKPEADVREFAKSFWGEWGKTRIADHEYDRVVKLVEKGEQKIEQSKKLGLATSRFVSHFENPWKELEFVHVNCRDKMFTSEEDRHLLCWSRKYGYGQWMAIKFAIRQNPRFRFNYFMRSIPLDSLARRCEQLMRAAEKEVEQLEREMRETKGLPVEPEKEGEALAPVEILPFRTLERQRRVSKQTKIDKQRAELEAKAEDVGSQIKELQARLKALTDGSLVMGSEPSNGMKAKKARKRAPSVSAEENDTVMDEGDAADEAKNEVEKGAPGPSGEFVEFPDYDGSEPPLDWRKPFAQYCNRTRKKLKSTLSPEERKNKEKVHELLKEGWKKLPEDKKDEYRGWTEWDKLRHARDVALYEARKKGGGGKAAPKRDGEAIPKKRRSSSKEDTVPKKKNKRG